MTKTNEKLRTSQEQDEFLDREIDLAPEKQDNPALQTLFSQEFLHMSDKDAAEVAKKVSELVRGTVTKEVESQFSKFVEFMEERDKESRKFYSDQVKWLEEQVSKGNKLKKTGSDADKIKAKTIELNKRAREEAVAESVNAILKFQERVASAPSKTIIGMGKEIRTPQGRKVIPDVFTKIVGNKAYHYAFPPNKAVTYPDFIIDEYITKKEMGEKFGQLDAKLKEFPDFKEVIKVDPSVDPSRVSGAIEQGQQIVNTKKGI